MKELLTEFLATILNEVGKEFKAVKKGKDGKERVVPFGSKENMQKAIAGPSKDGATYRPYNAKTDGRLEKEPDDDALLEPDTSRSHEYRGKPTAGVGSNTPSKRGRVSKADSTGAIILDTPIKTPQGNEVNAFITPEQLKPTSDAVNARVDVDRATTDELADVDIELHRRQELPEASDDYYARMQARKLAPESIQVFDDETRQILRDNGVSDHHVELLERAANTKLKGDIPPFTELTGGAAGAGKPPAQAGELVAGVLMTIRDPDDRIKVALLLNQMVENTESQVGTAILDRSWIEAALNQSEAFNSIMNAEYGEGNWEVDGFAWDTPQDIAGIGLEAKNKGFSTDIALRVNVVGQAQAKVARISLKKDGKIFLLNGSTSDVVRFAVQALDTAEREEYNNLDSLLSQAVSKSSTAEDRTAAEEQLQALFKISSKEKAKKMARERIAQLEEDALNKLPTDVREKIELVRTFSDRQYASGVNLVQQLSGKDGNMRAAAQKMAAQKTPKQWDEDEVKTAVAAHKALSSLPTGATEDEMKRALETAGVVYRPQDRFLKVVVLASELESNRDSTFKPNLDAHYKLAVEAGNAAVDAAVSNADMLNGLMYKLQETFPIRVIASGEESMCLGGVAVSRKTLTAMFGTDNLDDIRNGLTVITDKDTGQRLLIFRAEANGIQIPIALVGARQKGSGYQGTIGLEFKATVEFECAAAAANVTMNMNNNTNAKIVDRCQKQAAKKQATKPTK